MLCSFIWSVIVFCTYINLLFYTLDILIKYFKYYDSKLGSDCNLDKDLSKNGEDSQLVKHKDTGLYLYLFINHEKTI